MSIERAFIKEFDDEVILLTPVEETVPNVVVDYENEPHQALLTQCVEGDKGALLFSFDARHLKYTENGVEVSEALLCFASLIAYIPPGLEAHYQMVNDDGERGTLVLVPSTLEGFLN